MIKSLLAGFSSRKLLEFIAILIFVLGGWAFFASQIERSAPGGPRSFEMGLIFWPPFGEETPETLAGLGVGLTLENSEHILVQVSWSPHTSSAFDKVAWMSNLAQKNEHALTIAFDWMDEDRIGLRDTAGNTWSFDDPKVRDSFTHEASAIAAKYQPDFLLLGVEVDFLAKNNPEEFRDFVSLYQRVYRSVKEKSRSTRVSVTFQLESMKEMIENKNSLVESPIVIAFGPLLDILGLSVYPCQSVLHPDFLPMDYFASVIPAETPVAIFETGWPTGENDEHVQASYVAWLLSVASTVSVNPLIWASTMDGDWEVQSESIATGSLPPCSGRVSGWSKHLGLWKANGAPKNAASVWKDWHRRSPQFRAAQGEAKEAQKDHEAKLRY